MSARRSRFCVVVALTVTFVMMSGLAVTGACASMVSAVEIENPVVVAKVPGGPDESIISRTWTCPENGNWHQWIVNSGLKALNIDIYEKAKGKPISMYSVKVVFSEVGAYPSGTFDLEGLELVKDKIYKLVLEPSGRSGASAQYFHEFQGIAQPVASFTYTISGSTVHVDASGSSAGAGIVSYTWNWGDGTVPDVMTSPVTSHTYGVPQGTVPAPPPSGAPPAPFAIFGYTYSSDGSPLPSCMVTITNRMNGEYLTTESLDDQSGLAGFYQVDIGYLSWQFGDPIEVTAVKDVMFGSSWGILDYLELYLWIDVTLKTPGPQLVTLTVTDTLGQTSTMSHLVVLG